MPTSSLTIDEEVSDDLLSATAWYAERSVAVAARLIDAFEEGVLHIREFPHAGAPHRHGTRTARLQGFPFHIVYLVDGDSVRIVAVGHMRRDEFWSERL